MKAIENAGIVKLTALFAAFLFVLIAINKSVYIHTHIYENGEHVTHSHPYKKAGDSDPLKKHHHSQHHLFILTIIDEGSLFFFICLLSLFLFFITLGLNSESIQRCVGNIISSISPRAPPRFIVPRN